jgi:Putative antitoxin of bacterial toxin-antitoxin system, YdaS/YdaT
MRKQQLVLQDDVEDRKEAIAVLGGVVAVAKLCGVGRNAVSNWYVRGFPAEAYAVLGPRLRRAGYAFSDKLFKQHRPKNRGRR